MKDEYEFDGVRYVNSATMCSEFDIARITLAAWRKRGLLQGGIRLGGKWYYPYEDAKANIRRGEQA